MSGIDISASQARTLARACEGRGAFAETHKDATNAIQEVAKLGRFDVLLIRVKNSDVMAKALAAKEFSVMRMGARKLFVSWRPN